MNQDELDRLNDKTLAENERYFTSIEDEDDDRYDENGCCEADNIAEDEYMDERDGF